MKYGLKLGRHQQRGGERVNDQPFSNLSDTVQFCGAVCVTYIYIYAKNKWLL